MSGIPTVDPHSVGSRVALMVRRPQATDRVSTPVARARRARPLLGYWVTSSVGWRLAPLALAFALLLTLTSRGRPWVGDWVWGMTTASGHVLFTSAAVAAVAAFDAGSAFAGPAATAWDSVSRRGSDVVRLWLGALAPFLLVHLTTVMVVVALLVHDGAACGQTVAPLAQQVSVLALGGAIGVLAGVVGGARLGAFAATATAMYIIYIRGYTHDEVAPARLVVAGSPLIGEKQSEPLVAVQVASAVCWIVVLLVLAATSRWRAGERRLPRALLTVVGVGLLLAVTTVATDATAGWRDPVTTPVTRVCATEQGVTACLYQGHDRQLPGVLALAGAAHATAVRYGLGDLVPSRLTEVDFEHGQAGGFGDLVFDATDTSRAITHRTVLDALVPGQRCAVLLTNPPVLDPFLQMTGRVRQTMDDLATGLPPQQWHLTPARLRTYVENARRCDLVAAVGQE